MHTRDSILQTYGPQLGELAWHALHVDAALGEMSGKHAASMLQTVAKYRLKPAGRPIRILEMGAYAHHGAHLAAAGLGGESVAHDVSPASLRVGLQGAKAAGIAAEVTLVAGDFHDLPFSTGYFDLVFCASSVHHTWRPWIVLQEAMRVLRPGGALRLENEPVGRALCFYAFRSNRAPEFTPFEAELDRRGLLWTISSAFPGSRPEMLFGMIENDRIPLHMLTAPLAEAGRIASISLGPLMRGFEERVLALPRDRGLEAALAGLLIAEIDAVRPKLTERDILLGAKLPATDDIWRLTYEVAPRLRRLSRLSRFRRFGRRAARRELAMLFGAGLQATVIKRGFGRPAATLFRRHLEAQDQVLNDLPALPGVRLDLAARSLPAIGEADLAALPDTYPPEDWQIHREEAGLLSMLNLRAQSRIVLPGLPSEAMLLLRFFAVAAAEPYRIGLSLPGAGQIASVIVAQSESFLLRELLPQGCKEIVIETNSMDGDALEVPQHVRLGVCRLVPVGLV